MNCNEDVFNSMIHSVHIAKTTCKQMRHLLTGLNAKTFRRITKATVVSRALYECELWHLFNPENEKNTSETLYVQVELHQ